MLLPTKVALAVLVLSMPLVSVAAAQSDIVSSSAPESQSFKDGMADRKTWETWYGALVGADRDGATYWASHRSLAHPGTCEQQTSADANDWLAGCKAAQQRLAAIDIRRKTEPDYRAGFNTTDGTRIGPGFDCALARDALSGLICGSDQLSWTDLRFSQAYQALRWQVGEMGQSAVRQEAIDFQIRVYAECRLPKVGFVPPSFRAGAEICVGKQYEGQRGLWASRLSLPLQQEANRPLPQHLELQSALQKLGYIPAGSVVDGVYGPATRAAIITWQISRNMAPTGFFSLEEAAALRLEATAGGPPQPAPAMPPVTASAPAPPVPDEKTLLAAEERRLEIAKAEAEKAKFEADKAQADAARAHAEADVFAAKERAEAEVRRKAAEQAKAEQDAKGIQP